MSRSCGRNTNGMSANTKEKKRVGRPTKYTRELANEICKRIALGETEPEILKDEGMPSRSALYEWKRSNREFQDAFARARAEQHQAWADIMVSLAGDATSDFYVVVDKPKAPRRWRKCKLTGKAIAKFDRIHVERAKLMISTLQWLMMNRKGSDFSSRQTLTIEQKAYDGLTPEELEKELHLAAEQAGYRLVPLLKDVI